MWRTTSVNVSPNEDFQVIYLFNNTSTNNTTTNNTKKLQLIIK